MEKLKLMQYKVHLQKIWEEIKGNHLEKVLQDLNLKIKETRHLQQSHSKNQFNLRMTYS